MLGAPVDAVEPLHTDPGELVVGLVEEVRQHPNADRLRVCLVNDDTGPAPERGVRRAERPAGKRYSFARVGTSVPTARAAPR